MKLKKKLVKIGGVILLIVVLASGIYVYKYNKHKDEAINLVKSQTSNINEGVTFDQAYRKYVQHLSYTFYKDSEGNELVNINGKINMKDRDRIGDLQLTYIVDTENDTLKFYDMRIDDMKYSEVEALMLKIKAYGSYDGNNV